MDGQAAIETVAPVRVAATRSRGDAAVRTALLLLSWLSTYNAAYVNGDDVYHLQGGYGAAVFFPRFAPAWIPNRVFDLYGRNLLVHVFDLVYFPANSLFGLDFFFAYKIFNATLFALFLLGMHRYLRTCTLAARPLAAAETAGGVGTLASAGVALLLLLGFPWVDQVQFVCYQLPAFTCFVVLAELFARMPGLATPRAPMLPASALVTLAFVTAFSLEAYAAIMLLAVAFAWLLARIARAAPHWRSEAGGASLALAAFCLVALGVMVLYSARAASAVRHSPPAQLMQFFSASDELSHAARVECRQFLIGALGTALVLAAATWRRNREHRGPLPSRPARDAIGAWPLRLIVVLLPTIIVTSLVSLRTDYSYFRFDAYPFGAFLLPALLFAIPAALAPAEARWPRGGIGRASAALLATIAISSATVHVMDRTCRDYAASAKVLRAYRAMQAGAGPVFDTGLALDSIPTQTRPLPTPSSPQGFIDAYAAFFRKYYGVDTAMLFK